MSYKKYLPRVSDISSFIYPFEGKDKEWFINRLQSKWIQEDEYMKISSEWGTFIHKQMELYLLWKKVSKNTKFWAYIDSWIKLLEDKKIKAVACEEYVLWEWYQWTIDLIAEYKWESWIMDFKTFWLAKEQFWLWWRTKKPTDKLKKAELQLSLYAELKWIENIAVIEITSEWAYFHKLEKYPKEKINKIVQDFWINYNKF